MFSFLICSLCWRRLLYVSFKFTSDWTNRSRSPFSFKKIKDMYKDLHINRAFHLGYFMQFSLKHQTPDKSNSSDTINLSLMDYIWGGSFLLTGIFMSQSSSSSYALNIVKEKTIKTFKEVICFTINGYIWMWECLSRSCHFLSCSWVQGNKK